MVEPGGLCEGWLVQSLPVEDYNVNCVAPLLSKFSDYINGVVLYDPDPCTGVCSTSLVATTVAGVEGAIALRKDTDANSMYT